MPLQGLILGLALSLACIWLGLLARRPAVRLVVISLAIAASTATAIAAVTLRKVPPPERDVTGRPIETPDDGYVKSDACQSCHPSQYASWSDSYHSTMTRIATPQSVLGNFDRTYLEIFGDPYTLYRVGEEYFVDMVDPQYRREHGFTGTAPRVTRKIVLTTGSHHMQVYWYQAGEDRTLGQLPFVWLIKDQEWIPRVAAFVVAPQVLGHLTGHEEVGRWNDTCIVCHATRGEPRIDRPAGAEHSVFKADQYLPGSTLDTQVAEFGIACEACHGPASAHVAANHDPRRRYELRMAGKSDSTIVNPAELPPKLALQVCGQCHGTTELEDWSDWSQDGFTYRPGEDLTASRVMMTSDNLDDPVVRRYFDKYPTIFSGVFWPDGVVRVAGREYNGISVSPCYKNAPAGHEITCLSCHQMHQADHDPRPRKEWADDQLKPAMNGSAACTLCHDKYADPAAAAAHSHHKPGTPGDDCLNCHMPYQSYGLLKAIRSHTIASPNVAESIEGGRPNACNQCHLDKTYAWTAEYLQTWYGRETPPLTREEATVPASLIWLFSGDAAQRALVAWNLGWEEAHVTSGDEWIGAFLPQLLLDSYDAVRLIAYRSLHTLPGLEDFQCNVMAPKPDLERSAALAMKAAEMHWRSLGKGAWPPVLVIDSTGVSPTELYGELFRQRDDRPIYLLE
ncbi:MAG: C cytochrome precursor [Candidatus Eisenbacteria bacterium]|uniref:C cytochrome n=1 Tax=Eiseniibacteriota bacterium TaxID=2212470 RepID=A0A956LZV4_UNCEI|nr:C cytochrome precursor [Candidatus Eisenbacteria bacterium]